MNDSESHKDLIIKHIESANKENIERIKYLENLLLSKDSELINLKTKVSALSFELQKQTKKGDYSLKNLINYKINKIKSFIKALPMDITYALELLKREGIRSFINRTFWYLKGHRLIGDIESEKKSKYVFRTDI